MELLIAIIIFVVGILVGKLLTNSKVAEKEKEIKGHLHITHTFNLSEPIKGLIHDELMKRRGFKK